MGADGALKLQANGRYFKLPLDLWKGRKRLTSTRLPNREARLNRPSEPPVANETEIRQIPFFSIPIDLTLQTTVHSSVRSVL